MEEDNNWIFPANELKSISDEEKIERIIGIQFINYLATDLQIPNQFAIAIATTIFHRYYLMQDSKSQSEGSVWDIAASCLLLSAKITELCIPLNNVASSCRNATQKIDPKRNGTTIKQYWKDSLVYFEAEVISTVYYDLEIETPHKCLTEYFTQFDMVTEDKKLIWALANDSLYTDLCLRYLPKTIAAGLIYTVMKEQQKPLPKILPKALVDEGGSRKHQSKVDFIEFVKESDTTLSDIRNVMCEFYVFYKQNISKIQL
ncbi:hypothetical protein BC833DRAFT_578116, partial [Globomyces pollinis-pini]